MTITASAAPGGADPRELTAARDWARAAFATAPAVADAKPAQASPRLELRRQDHGSLGLGKSTLGTPLRVGSKKFAHGLGTHSVSEIVVHLPAPGKRFEARVGIDNNHDTGGEKGSVVFVVDLAGKEMFRSGVLCGSNESAAVKVELGAARRFTLRVLDAGDGPGWDQADWCDAAVTLEDGKRVWLDELPVAPLAAGPGGLAGDIPFSFRYGEKSSRDLLAGWKHEARPAKRQAGKQTQVTRWTDPATGLTVDCELTLFDDFPAAEWVLRFTNHGPADTPILADILPLDLKMVAPGEVLFRRSHGSTSTATDFLPQDGPVRPKSEITLAPTGGRSSSGVLPFFNLQWRGGGAAMAIGWSGQWALRLHRGAASDLTLQAGQQSTHLKLHPGESIRTPRILLIPWQGDDRFRGNNLLRRLLLAHYAPQIDGRVATPPVSANTWFTHRAGNEVTEANQLRAIAAFARLGVEVFWLDAGWFEGGWPNGVGSWVPKKPAFPNGLKPLGAAAHKAGMKFMVWFEPERVHPQSRIGTEHPEFVLRAGSGNGLFNLGNPKARAWLTDLLSAAITEGLIDIWRCDFNIDPLPFWQKADAPDRRGITEIRYVEGLYAMWDELRRRHPGLLIDNCASGGRRIDLETCSRSYALWRSDTQCGGRAAPVWDQVQTAGLSLYVPLHAAGLWGFDPYTHRSVAIGGACLCPDATAEGFPADAARAAIGEMKRLRRLYLGDYYPLTEIDLDPRHWIAWQFDRPELGEGLAVFFRRPASPYTSLEVSLKGLDPEATYEITFADTATTAKLTGKQLTAWRVTIDKAPASQLITYRKLPPK